MYLDEILNDYKNGEYENKLQKPFNLKKLKDNHVFDEDKSVKWNKEQVKLQHQEVEQIKIAYQKEFNRLDSKLRDDIIKGIMGEYDFNEKQAEIIYWTAYERHHSSGYYEIINGLSELCDTFKRFKEAE